MRILIVDDSMLVRSMLISLLDSIGGYEVIGQESNGKSAIDAVKTLHPDLLIMDINMPIMDGITATGIIMKEAPLPIIIFTSEDIASVGFNALNRGALEVIPKPDIGQINNAQFAEEFNSILQHAYKFGNSKLSQTHGFNQSSHPLQMRSHSKDYQIVVIGASTGGPNAVKAVLSGIPKNFPLPIILAQHIETGFDQGYADWLNDSTELNVKVAKNNGVMLPGEVAVAPANKHLTCNGLSLIIDDGPRIGNQKPSVDKMFLSAAKSFGSQVIGILLTGMGKDGAEGCKEIVQKGGETLIQNKETSMIFGMPKVAIEMGGATEVLPLDEISKILVQKVMDK